MPFTSLCSSCFLQGQFEDTKKRLESEHGAAMEKSAAKSAQDLAEKDAEMREALATAERDATEAVAKAQKDVETRIASAVQEWRSKLEEAQVCTLVLRLYIKLFPWVWCMLRLSQLLVLVIVLKRGQDYSHKQTA